jgi:hypothetical protein
MEVSVCFVESCLLDAESCAGVYAAALSLPAGTFTVLELLHAVCKNTQANKMKHMVFIFFLSVNPAKLLPVV